MVTDVLWQRTLNYRALQAAERRQAWLAFTAALQAEMLLNYWRRLFPDYVIQNPVPPPEIFTPTDLNRMLREKEQAKKSLALPELPEPEPPEPPEPPGFDVDALDFFARAAITDAVQQGAVNDLVLALKSAGIWTKMRALYPFVGGTASSHSENLKASSYRITWDGPITHNANGVTRFGAGSVDTNLNATTTVLGSIAFGVYQRTPNINGSPAIVALAGSIEYSIYTRFGDDVFYGVGGTSGQSINVSMLDASGFFVLSRESTTIYKAYKNGSQLGPTKTETSNSVPDASFKILPDANVNNVALGFICDGLLNAEVAALSSAVVAYQTALGRNV